MGEKGQKKKLPVNFLTNKKKKKREREKKDEKSFTYPFKAMETPI